MISQAAKGKAEISEIVNISEELANFKEEKPLKFEAIIPGHIVEKVTDQSDFGYDPIFIEDSLNKTYASMSEDEKNRVSHRGVALRKLLTYLRINGLAH